LKNPLQVFREWRIARAIATVKGTRAWYDAVSGQGAGSGFAGAAVNRLTASLSQWSGSVNADLDGQLPVLRARARQLATNNEFGRRFLDLVASNVIGPDGPSLQARATDSTGKLDKSANDAVEIHWAQWAETCDITGTMGLADLLRVVIKSVARDGECLARKVYDKKLPYGLGLQLLEADRLADTLNARLSNGNIIRQGVECDSMLRRVAYHIHTEHPGESYNSGPAKIERVPASQVIHFYLPERAEQVRGFTWFHAILVRAHMLHGFEEAAVVAARVGASKMGFFERDLDSMPESQLATMANSVTASGALTMDAEPGQFGELPPGYKFAEWNPDYPHANFESFVKQCMRGIASGLNVATHNLSGDMTDVNYSSARIAEMSERDHWRALQGWFHRRYMMPLYREWLQSSLLLGQITMDLGTPLPTRVLDKMARGARFQGRTWAWVDPLKEMEAQQMMLQNGLASRTELAVAAGREFDDIVGELAAEDAMLKAAGVTLGAKPAAPPPAPAPPPAAKSADSDMVRMMGKLGDMLGTMARTLELKAAEPPAPVHVVVEQADNHIHMHQAPPRSIERQLVTDASGEPIGVIERELEPAAPGVH
jgi:lambda family phage portal protein